MSQTPTIGIIGAGMAGLSCAQTLRAAGLTVTVLEKSRGLGGRLATRRLESGLSFDHGAQFFTAREPKFQAQVKAWLDDGTAELWCGRIVAIEHRSVIELEESIERFVGVPTMNAIAKSLATGIDVRANTLVQTIDRVDGQWQVGDASGELQGRYDILLTTAPPVQSLALVGSLSPELRQALTEVTMAPCWAVLLEFADRLPVDFDAAFVNTSPLGWIARNSSKPARHRSEHWVLHATASWSIDNLEASPEAVTAALTNEFWTLTQQQPQPIVTNLAHRWRYALPVEPLPQRCLFDSANKLGGAGDWCGGPRVEGAFLSGRALAEAVLATV